MKTKIYVLAALLMASMANVMADETCTKIWYDGEDWHDQAITYERDNTLFINKDKFSSAVVGNAIKIYGFDGEGDHTKIYLYGWNQILPGSDYRNPSNVEDNHVLFYLTEDMISAIRSQDLRVYGEGITVNRVEICDGKAGALKFGKTIWTGYFWMDEWTTLEMFKEAFNGIDLSKYRAIRFYHEAGRTDIVMNIFKDTWGDGDKIADQSTMTMTPTYAELPLTDAVIEKIGAMTSQMKIQCNKESGEAFNFTDVVLMPISPDGCNNCFYVY